MNTTHIQHDSDGVINIETEITRVDTAAVAVLNRSEIATQLDAAHRYPRSVKRFLDDAGTLATLNKAVAESCIYGIPRGGKIIAGPSVRLAEVCASAYGNLHVASRVLDVEDKEIVAQGVAWDLEKNLRVTVEARRRITNKSGKRFDDDMITVTGAAAGSIALRNAIFRVIPRAYVDAIYAKVRDVAVGTASTLAARRHEVVVRLQKMGVPPDRIFARVGVVSIEDVGLEELEVIIGLGANIKSKESTIDEAFPPVDKTAEKSRGLEAALGVTTAAQAPKAPKSAPASVADAPTTPLVERDPLTGEVVPADLPR